MSSQVQKDKAKSKEEEPAKATPGDLKAKGEEIKADLDGLMEEIEEVLETNAEEFVKLYVQRGGE